MFLGFLKEGIFFFLEDGNKINTHKKSLYFFGNFTWNLTATAYAS